MAGLVLAHRADGTNARPNPPPEGKIRNELFFPGSGLDERWPDSQMVRRDGPG